MDKLPIFSNTLAATVKMNVVIIWFFVFWGLAQATSCHKKIGYQCFYKGSALFRKKTLRFSFINLMLLHPRVANILEQKKEGAFKY